MTHASRIAGLRETAADYDLYLLDQFGVLHDGQRPYDGVIEALTQLRNAGKELVVLTNSGKRADANLQRLHAMGFPRAVISRVVSSGEVAWQSIRSGKMPPVRSGSRVFIVGRYGEQYGFDDLGLIHVEAPEDAEMIFILGSNAPGTSLEDYAARLAPAAKRGVPALCANPDIQMIVKGRLEAAPGAIAQVFARLGGRVDFVGKPYARIYEAALESFPHIPKTRVAAVGDSVEHDIRGAAGVGVSSILVRTGVLASLDDAALQDLFVKDRARPDYIVDRFCW